MPQKILVIHLAGIGDLLMGVPALASLRAGFPDGTILLLTWRKSRDVARLLTTVDECYGLEEGLSWRALRHNLSTLWRLRQRRVALAINLYQLYRWVGVAKLAGLLRFVRPARTAGRDTNRKGAIFDVKVPERSSEILHEVARQGRVVEQLGCPPAGSAIPLRLDDTDQQMVGAWLAAHGVAPDDALIGLHPGALRRCHRWPAESFASVANALTEAEAVRVVLIGSRDERRLAERIARQLDRPLVAAGELSLGQLACLMRRLRLLIANDSGPMHLAATLDVPLVALMGPTDPHRYGPYPLDRVNQQLLYAEGCAPCYRTSCQGHDSFEQLPPRVVLEAAEAILRGRRPSGLVRIRSRVRVLHVHTLPLVSGSGLNTFLSMQGQRDAGFTVALACAPAEEDAAGDLAALVERAGMRVRAIHHLRRAISPWHDFLAILELWRVCRREGYTIVHTHNSKAGIVGRLAAWLAGVPVIVHTYHSCVFRYRHLRPWQQRLFLWVERLAAPLTTSFIVISDALRQEFLAAGLARPDRIETIYSGIDLEEFQPGRAGQDGARQQLGLLAQDVVIGSVARLDVGKGHEELLEAFAQLTSRFPHAKLLCVGDGPLRRHLETRIQRLGLTDRVRLLGQRDDVPRVTQVFDIAVLASHYEGMGRVLLEAQAAGKPVVATRAGGMPEIVKDGHTGYLVPVGDARALAQALERLMADDALRARMGQAAVEWVGSRFSQQRMCERIQALYERLVREGTRCSTP